MRRLSQISLSANHTPGRVLSKTLLGVLALLFITSILKADDGYRLWLRYERLPEQRLSLIKAYITAIVVEGVSPTLNAIRTELRDGCTSLLGQVIPVANDTTRGAILVGTPRSSPLIRALRWQSQLAAMSPDGFRIRSETIAGHPITVIASPAETGALYGAFHFLRLIQTEQAVDRLDLTESPQLQLRMLNHWDNLDGSVERGYAGRSLWDWASLPVSVDQRLVDYARANASIGINGTALNNVNSNSLSLSPEYLKKTAAIADAFRPYGLRVFLSARFSAPMDLGGLKTADPLDPQVAAGWKKKASEIYALIPDFGGLLVKANSEGQPGPRTYQRDHVDGANMMAAALAPYRGIVVWRAFVYDMKPGYDRAGAAYENLQPFDGKFAANVLLQVKNGPIDFQPREPFHPLFGGMTKTQIMPELQITQEYLGFSNHLVFLAPMWSEVLESDTYAKGRGSTVRQTVDGSLFKQRLTGIAGVANAGSDRNWTGHHFAQANWYAFGRLAWRPDLTPRQIADEWVRMTLTRDDETVSAISRTMIESYPALVDYMTPLGLHHIMWGGHHYGPAPWWDKEKRDDWNPVYYHRADERGIGFDRTRTGSNTVSQYHGLVRDRFTNLATCPEELLLWFHHVPWDHRMKSGRILWDEMALHYQRGVEWARGAQWGWNALRPRIDRERHDDVSVKLAIQLRDATHWRDSVLLYFQTFSKRPLPAGVEPPAKTLEDYRSKSLSWLNVE